MVALWPTLKEAHGIDLLASAAPQILDLDSATWRGDRPTADHIDFQNKNSEKILEAALTQRNGTREGLEYVLSSIRQIKVLEEHSSALTRAKILRLEAELLYDLGRDAEAEAALEKAGELGLPNHGMLQKVRERAKARNDAETATDPATVTNTEAPATSDAPTVDPAPDADAKAPERDDAGPAIIGVLPPRAGDPLADFVILLDSSGSLHPDGDLLTLLSSFATDRVIIDQTATDSEGLHRLGLLEYAAVETFQLTASPHMDWAIDGWTGTGDAVTGGDNTTWLRIEDDAHAQATFTVEVYNIGPDGATDASSTFIDPTTGLFYVTPFVPPAPAMAFDPSAATTAYEVDAGLGPFLGGSLTLPGSGVQVRPPRERLLAIGVDDYVSWDFAPLDYAVTDARRMVEAFDAVGYDTGTLANELATRDRILSELEHEARLSRPGDRSVLYFAGHGFSDDDGDLALVTGDGFALGVDELRGALSGHRGEALVVLDACFTQRDLPFDRYYIENLITGAADDHVTVVMASAPGQPALESRELQGGVFTHALLAALEHQTREAGLESINKMTILGLVNDISRSTADLAAARYGTVQTPVIAVDYAPDRLVADDATEAESITGLR